MGTKALSTRALADPGLEWVEPGIKNQQIDGGLAVGKAIAK